MIDSTVVFEIAARLAEALGTPMWRRDLEPLNELIQTILSQHTASANSRLAYERLRDRFPTWDDLRNADIDTIADAIRPAGLAQLKAPRIKRIVAQVYEERGDYDLTFLADLPPAESMAWLMRLPGVGQTTAACCLLFGLRVPVMPVDSGIERVAGRLGLVRRSAPPLEIEQVLEAGIEANGVYPLHVNLIHFGREICRPSEPLCGVCPLNDLCAHFVAGATTRVVTTVRASARPRRR